MPNDIERPEWADNRQYDLDSVITTEEPLRSETEAGDTVYIVGLFHLVHGAKRNLPVTYSGNVVLMPRDERIPVGDHDVEGYLVQANPISGCSGAPVWAARLMKVEPPLSEGSEPVFFFAHGKIFLLGIWSSSWKVKGSEIVTMPVNDDDDDKKGTLAPLGMGVVVPVSKLIEIFRETDVAKERADKHKAKRTEGARD